MMIRKSQCIRGAFGWSILGLALLAWTGPASAQTRTGGATGTASSGGFSGGFSGGGLLGGTGGFSGSSGGFSGGFSGSSGGFSGGSFSGGFSGSSGGFSGGSFSGNTGSFSGGSFSGTMTGGRPGGTGFGSTTYQGVSNTNPFYQSYQDPLAGGIGSGTTTRTTFGVPMYNLTTTTGTGNLTGGSALGITGGTNTVNFTPSPATYMTTPFLVGFGTPAGPTVPAPPRTLPPAVAGRMQREAQQVIRQSSALPSKGDIRVGIYGPAVVLQGVVSDEHERRLAEGLVRLTPGINEVVNQLQVRTELTAPRAVAPP